VPAAPVGYVTFGKVVKAQKSIRYCNFKTTCFIPIDLYVRSKQCALLTDTIDTFTPSGFERVNGITFN
jgi:hypothetical protein